MVVHWLRVHSMSIIERVAALSACRTLAGVMVHLRRLIKKSHQRQKEKLASNRVRTRPFPLREALWRVCSRGSGEVWSLSDGALQGTGFAESGWLGAGVMLGSRGDEKERNAALMQYDGLMHWRVI